MKDFSYAKINLSLDIFKKIDTQDFHTVKTIFHKISLADEIKITENDTFQIIWNFSCKMEDNLIFKAFQLIKKYAKSTPNVRVEIIKNIPEKAGLGWGSSNFSTFVKMYFELFHLWDIPQELIQESWNFWKDIPFFFSDKPCMIWENFGEKIIAPPFPWNQFSWTSIWIYKPDFKNCTKTMYKKLHIYENGHTDRFLKGLNLSDCWNTFDEFLEEAEYQKILKWINTKKIHLCGSGSSFFSFEKLEIKWCERIKVKLV
jgi:4-diphosphocytidyl-2C-methyl-D-erythritol kinase